VVEADLAGRGDGAVGLAGFLGQQPVAVGRLEQAALDLGLVEGAGGDEVEQISARLPQLPVAAALGALATRANSAVRAERT
jgi:hypothetical protein